MGHCAVTGLLFLNRWTSYGLSTKNSSLPNLKMNDLHLYRYYV